MAEIGTTGTCRGAMHHRPLRLTGVESGDEVSPGTQALRMLAVVHSAGLTGWGGFVFCPAIP